MELLPFFEWAETSFLGYIGKTYGGVYATFGQSIHLMSLAVLGGSVLVTDLRLLGVIMKDVPSEVVADQAHKWFRISLAFILATGIFMAAAVAQRMYYNDFFWAKMSALLVGIIFVFAIKRPLLKGNHADVQPWLLKLVAVASILVWFSVAATGRWIGFS
ncbi:MAG: hypothetical protein CMQ34_13370 [Gammaproteobacteria bacterium]|mgnify:FL=1|nr:hypothetical protein [Gammaproteobacteria bacterium]|tara:strand:- start:3705 stop:4184 length:480 start_codon:yes stop_codon:yes gene_type:complete